MKPLLALMLLLLHFPSNNTAQADIIDDLSVHFKVGNSKEIAKNFAGSVELIIIDQEDVYSKAQAEQILRDFFVKNSPNKIAIVHRLSTNPNYRLGIFSLGTKTGKFRVTITLKKNVANAFLITELRIEPDKE
ncbi:DUF4783 domain-containing protein [Pedobacter sp. LMG 31464]|uniref:DUF4783 domain-containing protein n=1 Tax=Pedobacter planticolens TaxID=2679964 RepID=A0A923DWX6_9SPHI|nr:DUF4783 domain-containing protein [Pedobacter planticolens]MBB2145519.1 DUF4783 domain-containing protein [Pedobacter planticolens]